MSGDTQNKNFVPVVFGSTTANAPKLPDLPAEMTSRISQRAYELYSSRGCEDGHALEDWLRAEIDILHC